MPAVNTVLPAFGTFAAAVQLPSAPARVAFDEALLGTQASLRAEVEPAASGLGVTAHAERVLSQLLGDAAPAR